MSAPDPSGRAGRFSRELTPAQVRERTDHVAVAFLESARFYKLPRTHPSFGRILGLLRNAIGERRLLKVSLAYPDGDVIEDIQER